MQFLINTKNTLKYFNINFKKIFLEDSMKNLNLKVGRLKKIKEFNYSKINLFLLY